MMPRLCSIVFSVLSVLPGRTLATPALARPSVDGFDGRGSFCNAVWTDGEDRLVTGCNSLTALHTRGVKAYDLGGPRRPGQVDGLGRGAEIVLAIVTEDGRAARLEGGRWQEGAPEKEKLVAAAVDAHGRTWFAGERSLHLWQGSRWTAFPYPRAGTSVVRAVRGDGGLYLATRDGAILHADGRGAFTAIPLALEAGPTGAEVKGLWFSQRSRRLYLLRDFQGLIVLDRRTGALTTTRLETWGTALTGLETPGGDVVVIAEARALLGYHEGRLYKLAATAFLLSFVRQLAYSPRDGKLYIASQGGVFTYPLAPLLSPEGRAKLSEVGGAERPGRSSGITYPGRITFVSAALALGPGWNRVPGAETTATFTLDAELGLRMPFAVVARHAIALWPTVGYSYDAHDAAGGHRFVGGLGLTLFTRNLLLGVTAASRFVAGSVGETRALGVRSGLRLELYLGLLAIDVAHQALFTERTVHGVRLTFGLDFMAWLRIFRFFSFLSSPSWSGAKGLGRALGL